MFCGTHARGGVRMAGGAACPGICTDMRGMLRGMLFVNGVYCADEQVLGVDVLPNCKGTAHAMFLFRVPVFQSCIFICMFICKPVLLAR